jgi:hypothetical protein
VSRATELTDAVTAPARPVVPRETIDGLRARLAAGLAPAATGVGASGPLVVTLPLLCRAQSKPSGPRPVTGFAWSPFFVRRSLGAAIVDECLRRGDRSPAEVAVAVLDDAVDTWRRTGARRFHWEPWVAGLPPGGRATVLADALTWATALWSSFDWAAFPERPVAGGAAEQWTTPEARGVRLTSRPDLKVPAPRASERGTASDRHALVSILNGTPPRPGSAVLAYPVLVTALCAPRRRAPTRSVGLWPDAGHVESLDVDAAALEAAADLVVETAVRWSRMETAAAAVPEPATADPGPVVALAG